MLVSEAIARIKAYCHGIDAFTGESIDDATTRDKVTYGNPLQECTGIATCIWPTSDVIRRARELGANLIIPHEALFWNHGDHQDVIADNSAYLAKKKLLDDWGGTVWRCHDYIHSRVPIDSDGALADGIFYGLAWKLGWLDYRVGDRGFCLDYEIPDTRVEELASYVVEKLGLNGVRYTGDSDALVRRVRVPMHVFGTPADTDTLNATDSDGIDCLMTMEMVDFTTCEYIRDAGMLGLNKCAVAVGHFNLEEPGMEYMVNWLPNALGTSGVPMSFVPMGDTYRYVTSAK